MFDFCVSGLRQGGEVDKWIRRCVLVCAGKLRVATLTATCEKGKKHASSQPIRRRAGSQTKMARTKRRCTIKTTKKGSEQGHENALEAGSSMDNSSSNAEDHGTEEVNNNDTSKVEEVENAQARDSPDTFAKPGAPGAPAGTSSPRDDGDMPGAGDHVEGVGGQDGANKLDTGEHENIGEGDGGHNEANPGHGDVIEPIPGETTQGAEQGETEGNEEKEEEYSDEWTAAKEDKLIDLYRESKHLWDKTAPGYKTRHKLEIAQKAWTKELLTPYENIKQRLKTLRDTYTRAKSKGASGSEAKDLTARQKFVAGRLSFLSGHVKPRGKTLSTTDESSEDDDDHDDTQEKQDAQKSSGRKTPQKVSPAKAKSSPVKNNPQKTTPKKKTPSPKQKSTPKRTTPRKSSASKVTKKSPAARALNMDCGSMETPSTRKGCVTKTPTCKGSSCKGKGKKRYSDGAPKRQQSPDSTETPDYTSVIKDLAKAVSKTPPKKDKLEKWSDVLVDSMRDLPDDLQDEARHHIDGYIMSLRRSLRSYPPSSQAPPGNSTYQNQGATWQPPYSYPPTHQRNPSAIGPPPSSGMPYAQQRNSSSIGQSTSGGVTGLPYAQSQSTPPSPDLHQLENVLPPYPSGVDTSPGASQLLRRIMGNAGAYPNYPGPM